MASIRRYYGRPEVQGIAIGLAYRAGAAERRHAIRVHVSEKVPETFLEAATLLRSPIPGVRLDVTEGTFVDNVCASFSERTDRSAVIQPGLSVGRKHGGAGTLGAIVEDQRGVRYVLTAGHVIVSALSDAGDPIYQPAPEDGEPEKIASLAAYSRVHDAALAAIASKRKLRPRPVDVARRFSGVAQPYVGQVLRKSGRSTCCTRALVDAIGPFGTLQRAVWLRPLPGEPDDARICEDGDSGAVWFDEQTMKAVSLHLKGDAVLGSRAIGVQLASDAEFHYVGVLERLHVKIV